MILKFIKQIINNYKMTMNNSTTLCMNCNHYSYRMVHGGLGKIEHCRKEHKEGKEDCPDYMKFVFSDWDSCIYYNGRVER